jgi:hypothetical protein
MGKLKNYIETRQFLAVVIAVALGVSLSYVSDATQFLFLPIGEWARVTFIARTENSLWAENIVNFIFHFISFGLASICVLLLMQMVLTVRNIKYPMIAVVICLTISWWWVPLGFAFGFDQNMLPVLSLIPIVVLATTVAFFTVTFLVIQRTLSVSTSAIQNESSLSGYFLWIVLAGAITVGIMSDFSLLSLSLVVAVLVLYGLWLYRHRSMLCLKYKKAEATATISGPYDTIIWGSKPRLRDMAPGLVALGLVGLYFAYMAAHGDRPTRSIEIFIHRIVGVPGLVAMWSLMGSCFIAKGIETIVGSRIKQ